MIKPAQKLPVHGWIGLGLAGGKKTDYVMKSPEA